MNPTINTEDYRIEANENPYEGVCSITEAFTAGKFKTGIPAVDNIKVKINDCALYDSVKLIHKPTGKTVFEIKGQRALLLDLFAEGIISYFKIKIIK